WVGGRGRSRATQAGREAGEAGRLGGRARGRGVVAGNASAEALDVTLRT
ncbi:TPA: alginate biosynthesis protein AlgP, partial [Burkholderia vietnamiensis]|nr:alginate biosynthesis protein AlgP [Burkholderia vietnamiensis]HEP6287903.1 alginate biosynthesis protein AlgP [Burkholderia vietnamiensis]